jgi:HK97 family phage prohead protease
MTVVLQTKRATLALETVDCEGEFSGYASVFGEVDLASDAVERGAFARSLRQRGASGVRMLYQHDPNEPIGRWDDIREDSRGLYVRGRLQTSLQRGREVLALMRDGGLDGLSIGYRTVRARKDGATGIRRILEADLWEISVVTFPMLESARVAAVKSAGTIPTRREFERWLTQDAGLTRSQARTVMTKGFASLGCAQDAAPGSHPALAGVIRRAAHLVAPKGTLTQ